MHANSAVIIKLMANTLKNIIAVKRELLRQLKDLDAKKK